MVIEWESEIINAPLFSLYNPAPSPEEDADRKEKKMKKWTDALTKPPLDYSELFPEILNGSVGNVSQL